ncbi:hypothetical protein BD309DRAFT_985232 [Dichomitus squalens]|nr:hypothetical protein BD309DRAFT_985232 [Dichomitus squalens]
MQRVRVCLCTFTETLGTPRCPYTASANVRNRASGNAMHGRNGNAKIAKQGIGTHKLAIPNLGQGEAITRPSGTPDWNYMGTTNAGPLFVCHASKRAWISISKNVEAL